MSNPNGNASDLTRAPREAPTPAGVPAPRPLRTFRDVVWKDTPAPAPPPEPVPLPPVEIDPRTGAPVPRPLRRFDQIVWEK